ncbi:hypothetical protein LIA77_03148 [Sarocladium implicatum]|nr:hypothetical protein LIA77_03148 [Sarocladium implicatum]
MLSVRTGRFSRSEDRGEAITRSARPRHIAPGIMTSRQRVDGKGGSMAAVLSRSGAGAFTDSGRYRVGYESGAQFDR